MLALAALLVGVSSSGSRATTRLAQPVVLVLPGPTTCYVGLATCSLHACTEFVASAGAPMPAAGARPQCHRFPAPLSTTVVRSAPKPVRIPGASPWTLPSAQLWRELFAKQRHVR